MAVLADVEIILPLSGLIDKEAEAAKHRKALLDLNKQLSGIRAKLNNEGFVARAPAEVVAQQRAREAELSGADRGDRGIARKTESNDIRSINCR